MKMSDTNLETNVLYYGDNLPILRKYIPDESIDLVYLDPPFNSKATYNILFKEPTGEESKAQVEAFEDTWHWTEETERTFQEIVDTAPSNVVNLMTSLREAIRENDMMAYLTMMCIRLLELKRILKRTGSIYLHCDSTASHYLKLLMDCIFGVMNFRNEIVWRRSTDTGSSKAISKKFPANSDTLLFYTKSNTYIFNPQFEAYTEKYLTRFKYSDETGKFRWQCLKTYSEETLKKLENEGRIRWGKKAKNPEYKQYEWELKGVLVSNIWTDINQINPAAKERLGYPTQKPEKLLERIIKSSSNEGDIILDPFCGCGTALVSAQRLNRGWIGIDITHLAISLMKWRLKTNFPDIHLKVIGEPADLSSTEELASQNKYQFQWWALSLIGARPYGDKKRGADTGIDGFYYFNDGGKTKKAIVSVKGGHVDVSQIRDLKTVVERESAAMGFFITLNPATRPMKEEAVKAGFYKDSFGNQYPKIQILTIEEIFEGKIPDTPQKVSSLEAEKSKRKRERGTQRELS
jgi:adenine specific DNA methylase Mod